MWDDALLRMEDRRESKGVLLLSERDDDEEYSEDATDWMDSEDGRPTVVDNPSRPKLVPRLAKCLLGCVVSSPTAVILVALCKQCNSGNFSTAALPGE